MNSKKNSFGKRIKMVRKNMKMSQSRLGNLIGCSQTAIHKLECGFSKSSRHTVQIAMVCCVEPVWLTTGCGEMSSYRYSADSINNGENIIPPSEMNNDLLIESLKSIDSDVKNYSFLLESSSSRLYELKKELNLRSAGNATDEIRTIVAGSFKPSNLNADPKC